MLIQLGLLFGRHERPVAKPFWSLERRIELIGPDTLEVGIPPRRSERRVRLSPWGGLPRQVDLSRVHQAGDDGQYDDRSKYPKHSHTHLVSP